MITVFKDALIVTQNQNRDIVKGDLDTDDLSAILMYIAKKITADQFPLDKLPTTKN